MKTNTQIFLEFRDRFIKSILNNPDYKEAKASGNFEEFIRSVSSYIVSENKFTQFGTEYTVAIDKGRPPNSTNSGGLKESIYNWLQYRKYGLDWQTESQRRGLAFVITRKIAREGTYKFRNKSAQTNIVAGSVNKELPLLLTELAANQADELGLKIKSVYGNINK